MAKQWSGRDGNTGVKLVNMNKNDEEEPSFVRYAVTLRAGSRLMLD